MTRTIESPLGWMRLFPVMGHMPTAATTQDAKGSEQRESIPVIETIGGEDGAERDSDPVAA